MSILPRKTMPERYAACWAWRSPWRRGAGVSPPSGERLMLRALQTSTSKGHAVERYGQPSCTMSFASFHDPALALRSRNSSKVITPSLSAWRPYWTPTLRSEEHTSELQSRGHLVCRLLLEKKKQT